MSRKKPRTRQHFVPQCYLRYFTDNGRSVWAYDKFTRNSFRASTKHVAQEQNFYDYPPGTRLAANPDERVDRQQVEKALAYIEGGFSDLLVDRRRVKNATIRT